MGVRPCVYAYLIYIKLKIKKIIYTIGLRYSNAEKLGKIGEENESATGLRVAEWSDFPIFAA
jgi:hypothetical protein